MERPHAQQVREGQEAVAAALAQLEAIKRALRRPVAEGLEALVDATRAVQDAAKGAGEAALGGQLRRLKSLLLEVAQTLGSNQPNPASEGLPAARVVHHFYTTCCAIQAVARLAAGLGAKLSAAEAAQLAVSLSYVLRNAPGFLSTSTAAARGNPLALGTLCESLARTLDAAGSMLLVLHSNNVPERLYASSVFPSAVVVPFLQALTDGLDVALAAPAERTRGLTTVTLSHYTLLLHLALRPEGVSHLVASMAARPALCSAIAGVLLAHVLPRTAEALPAAGSGGRSSVRAAVIDGGPVVILERAEDAAFTLLQGLGQLLALPQLCDTVKQHLRRPGGSAAVRHAAAVLKAMPGAPPAGWSQDAFGALLTCCATLVSILGHNISSESVRADGRGSPAEAAAFAAEQEQAAWELVGAVPALARLIRAAAATQQRLALVKVVSFSRLLMSLLKDVPGDITSPAQLAALAAAAGEVARLMPLLMQVNEQWPELLAACSSGERAGLSAEPQSAPMTIATLLWQHVWYEGSCATYNWALLHPDLDLGVGAGGEQVLAALPATIWQAHSSSCRLLHHIAGCRSHALIEPGGASADWRVTRQTVDLWFCTAVRVTMAAMLAADAPELAGLQPGQGLTESQAETQIRAMCAAHWAAVQAGAAAVHTLQPIEPEPDANPHGSCGQRSDALRMLCMQRPLLLTAPDAQGRSPLDALFAELQASGTDPLRNALPRLLFNAGAEGGERLAVALLRGGWVALAMRRAGELEALSSAGSVPPTLLNGYPLHIVQQVTDAALDAAEELERQVLAGTGPSSSSAAGNGGAGSGVGGSAGSNPSGPSLAQAGSASSAVPEQPTELWADLLSTAAQLGELAGLRDAAGLQAAEHAAALLQRFWALPQQVEAARVELAQAAAARSCANLRCANAELGGGPAAGEGQGCKRCSGCRVVWYCGTTCSHADWRAGGHKRVCKLLAAAGPAV